MKYLLSFLTFILSLTLTACKDVEVENGAIPLEHVSNVKPYLGRYFGAMDGKYTEITLSMVENIPVMTVANAYGGDVLVRNCNSSIGKLLTFKVEDLGNNQYQLERVTFAINPGRCRFFEGKTLVLEFTTSSKFKISILKKDTRQSVCTPSSPSLPGAPPLDPTCNEVGDVTYLRGHFSKY